MTTPDPNLEWYAGMLRKAGYTVTEPSAVEEALVDRLRAMAPFVGRNAGFDGAWVCYRAADALAAVTEEPRQRPPEPSAVEEALVQPRPEWSEAFILGFRKGARDQYARDGAWIDSAVQGLWKAANAHVAKVEAERDEPSDE